MWGAAHIAAPKNGVNVCGDCRFTSNFGNTLQSCLYSCFGEVQRVPSEGRKNTLLAAQKHASRGGASLAGGSRAAERLCARGARLRGHHGPRQGQGHRPGCRQDGWYGRDDSCTCEAHRRGQQRDQGNFSGSPEEHRNPEPRRAHGSTVQGGGRQTAGNSPRQRQCGCSAQLVRGLGSNCRWQARCSDRNRGGRWGAADRQAAQDGRRRCAGAGACSGETDEHALLPSTRPLPCTRLERNASTSNGQNHVLRCVVASLRAAASCALLRRARCCVVRAIVPLCRCVVRAVVPLRRALRMRDPFCRLHVHVHVRRRPRRSRRCLTIRPTKSRPSKPDASRRSSPC